MMARIQAAVQASEGAAQLEVVGKSVQGRDIMAVRFRGKGFSSGMPRLMMSYTVHAREWITSMAGIYAVEKLDEMTRDDPELLTNQQPPLNQLPLNQPPLNKPLLTDPISTSPLLKLIEHGRQSFQKSLNGASPGSRIRGQGGPTRDYQKHFDKCFW